MGLLMSPRRRHYLCFRIVLPSVRSLKPSFHMCPHPTNRDRFSARPSVRPERFPGIFPENAWREWPKILHAGVCWPHSELIRLWSRSGDFVLILELFWISETGQICGFRAFLGERRERMVRNFACWCTLLAKKVVTPTLKTIKPMWIELLCFHLAEIGMIWTRDCSPTKSDTTLGRHSMQGQVGSSSSETTV